MSVYIPTTPGSRARPSSDARPVVTVVESVGDFGPYASAFDRLVSTGGAPASMYWSALEPWLRHRPWCRPLLVLVHRGETLVAAAMLAYEPMRVGCRVTKIGTLGEPFSLLVTDEQAAAALADGVRQALDGRRWWLWLTDLPAPDPCVDLLVDGLHEQRRTEVAETPVLDVGATVDARERPSRNTRQAAGKARNRIEREGHRLALSWLSDAADVRRVLPELIDLHIRRNEHLDRDPLLLDQTEQALFRETVLGHAAAGRARLLTSRIDDRLAAFALCLASGRRWWAYANYADPEWLHFSPGTITNAEVIRCAHADPDVDTLDWGAGIQRYKLSGGARLESRQLLDASSSSAVQLMRNLNQAFLRVVRKQPQT